MKTLYVIVIFLYSLPLFSAPKDELKLAIENGSLKGVKSALQTGIDVNEKLDSHNNSPLLLASEKGHLKIVKYLLPEKADINHTDASGGTALKLAAEKGHLAVVKVLVENRADLEIGDGRFGTPLYYATMGNYGEIARYLIKNGANVKTKLFSNTTPLMQAAGYSDSELVKILLEKGAEVNIVNGVGLTALMSAVNTNQIENVKLLINAGATLNNVDNFKMDTALHTAVKKRYYKIAELLIEKGTDYTIRNKKGLTPLVISIQKIYDQRSKRYFRGEGVVNKQLKNKNTFFIKAVVKKAISVKEKKFLKYLLFIMVKYNYNKSAIKIIQSGINVNTIIYEKNYTALHVAMSSNNKEMIKYLLEQGASIKAEIDPLFTAVKYHGSIYGVKKINSNTSKFLRIDYKDVVKLLLKKGAILDENILIYAVKNSNAEMIEFLLKKGAPLDRTDSNLYKYVIINYANTRRYPGDKAKIVKVLIKYRVNLNKPDKEGYPPLMHAVFKQNKKIVRLLLEAGAIVNFRDKDQSTALLQACSYDTLEIVTLLLKHGASLKVKDRYGFTPMDYALENGNQDIIKWIKTGMQGRKK